MMAKVEDRGPPASPEFAMADRHLGSYVTSQPEELSVVEFLRTKSIDFQE